MADDNLNQNGSFRYIVWHPDLHRKFSEELYFFFITPEVLNEWFELIIEKNLRACGVRGWGLYSVFGYHDILVVAWMSQEQSRSFNTQLQKDSQ